MDLLRFVVVRYLLRAVRRLLVSYLDRHHPELRRRIKLALQAVDVALESVEGEAQNHVDRIRHPMHHQERGLDPQETGSDDQMTDEQRAAMERRADLEQAWVVEEERKTAAQRPHGDEG